MKHEEPGRGTTAARVRDSARRCGRRPRLGANWLAYPGALLSLALILASGMAFGQSVSNGEFLYRTWCAGCHGADPRQSQPHLAANKPKVLRDAMDLVSQMNFLKTVLVSTDVDDIAAYIGSVATTGVVVLNPTPASIDFSYTTLGAPGTAQTLLLTNLGSAPLEITGIEAVPADFAISGECLGTRNPSSTCALQVTFAPLAAGSIAGSVRVRIAGAEQPLLIPLSGAGQLSAATPLPIVVEYYNPDLDHYFITSDALEQQFVDSGAVGRWLRTGNAFRAGGPSRVCRFYGNAATDPGTGRIYGPNSHFYTVSAPECEGLKALFDATKPAWKFESLDFAATLPAGQACAAGSVPVYRAYNNGIARGIESNHRITTNRTAIEQVTGRGWVDEGVTMCVPASP